MNRSDKLITKKVINSCFRFYSLTVLCLSNQETCNTIADMANRLCEVNDLVLSVLCQQHNAHQTWSEGMFPHSNYKFLKYMSLTVIPFQELFVETMPFSLKNEITRV